MRIVLLLAFLLASTPFFSQTEDEKQIKAIYDMALTNGKAYDWLNYLSNQIGGRLSGSVQAQHAVDNTKTARDGAEMGKGHTGIRLL